MMALVMDIVNTPIRNSTVIVFLYFCFILVLAPYAIPGADAYYYWSWSQHLAWSYFDGPPMIAYFIKLSTSIFGNNLFALNVQGAIIAAITALTIYKTARLFLNKEASIIAMLLWLFSLSTTKYIIRDITYDGPLTLFWALTLYYLIAYIQSEKKYTMYFCGICIGLMLLSKYSGIVLVIAILTFLLTTSYRRLFLNLHFYIAMLLAFLILSPVLIWNYQQDWISFTYLSKAHHREQIDWSMMHTLFQDIIPALNVFLLPPFICGLKWNSKKVILLAESLEPIFDNSLIVYLCMVTCSFFVGFYLITGIMSKINHNWLGQYIITSVLLAGYCYQHYFNRNYRQCVWFILLIFLCCSVEVILRKNNYSFINVEQREPIEAQLIREFNVAHPSLTPLILAPLWQQAAQISFFLSDKPQLHVLDCGTQNQYRFWGKQAKQTLEAKEINEVMYMFIRPPIEQEINCLYRYVKTCKMVWKQTAKNYNFQVLTCSLT